MVLRQRQDVTYVTEKLRSIKQMIPKLYLIASLGCMNGMRILLFTLFGLQE